MKFRKKTFIILLLLLLLSIAIFFLYRKSKEPQPPMPSDTNVQEWNGNQDLPKAHQERKQIAIPSVQPLVFTANETAQKVNFYNPTENEENGYLFLMSLFIEDEEYWKSDGYVQPGMGFYDIELTQTIDVGTYDAYLHIQCFKPDGTALNSAKVATKITVQED